MRIGLVVYGDLAQRSGGYLYDRMLARNLSAWGHQVQVLSLPILPYGRALASGLLRPPLSPATLDNIEVLLLDELCHPSLCRLDSYDFHGGPVRVGILHHLRCDEPHPPPLKRLYASLEGAFLRQLDGLICNTETSLQRARQLRPDLPAGVVAYPAADHLPQAPLSPPPHTQLSPLRLVFIGNLIPRKGLHLLFRALMDLPAGSWRLTVVGDASFDPRYARRMRRYAARRFPRFVHWLGAQPPAGVARVLQGSHLLVVPSLYEGFGIVYLEAMAYGVPPLATTAGGAHELIRDGVNGFLVPPGDSAALAARLAQVMANPQCLPEMGRAARSTYSRHPTWKESAYRVHRFLLSTWPHLRGQRSSKGGDP
jgi:glycosyltransferase involved in cell wall biosynthesis